LNEQWENEDESKKYLSDVQQRLELLDPEGDETRGKEEGQRRDFPFQRIGAEERRTKSNRKARPRLGSAPLRGRKIERGKAGQFELERKGRKNGKRKTHS